jgi:hypothetical protein
MRRSIIQNLSGLLRTCSKAAISAVLRYQFRKRRGIVSPDRVGPP